MNPLPLAPSSELAVTTLVAKQNFSANKGARPTFKILNLHRYYITDFPKNESTYVDFTLRGRISPEKQTALRCITAGSDWVEEQNFPLVHQIIFGIFQSSRD
ncbi:uncharacterized protein LY89DRAFT_109646 [Mollisia scopiformis]|uniref:Uncharacterized protein n=1 Tax=Mollisia scopiformis TaxID=149040 RepID=A0A194X580_MOLSC|nr:uncharacterized protein LY89DRAFT_109646 [Mollisia scopiformis]KUJ15338.1 hypothetical protein LY89DRAFT_109646 [Mollisia scopiformis]